MQGPYKVITLCGSTRFKDQFIEAQKRLTLEGNIVISVGLFGHSGDNEVWSEGTKEMLDDMHKRKIDMADEIFVINVGGYIGSSTKSEIEYAQRTGKTVRYLEDPDGNNQTVLSRYITQFTSLHTAKRLAEPYGMEFVVQNPPQKPLTMEEMDAVYDLPYERTWHRHGNS